MSVHKTWRSEYLQKMARIRLVTRRDRVTSALLQIDRHASFTERDAAVAHRNLNGGWL